MFEPFDIHVHKSRKSLLGPSIPHPAWIEARQLKGENIVHSSGCVDMAPKGRAEAYYRAVHALRDNQGFDGPWNAPLPEVSP